MVKVKVFIFEKKLIYALLLSILLYFYDILSNEHNILHTNIKFEDESIIYVPMNFSTDNQMTIHLHFSRSSLNKDLLTCQFAWRDGTTSHLTLQLMRLVLIGWTCDERAQWRCR
jgi:hypothetical protein